MRATYILVIAALAFMVTPAVLYADSNCCPSTTSNCKSASCPTPAYDRTPICVIDTSPSCCGPMGAGPQVIQVDPWAKCGAFCSGGQLSPGWPYGWNSEYWLRPNSNF